jgi:hypothetical protein
LIVKATDCDLTPTKVGDLLQAPIARSRNPWLLKRIFVNSVSGTKILIAQSGTNCNDRLLIICDLDS